MTFDEQRLRSALRNTAEDWHPTPPQFTPPARDERRAVKVALAAIATAAIVGATATMAIRHDTPQQQRVTATAGSDVTAPPTSSTSPTTSSEPAPRATCNYQLRSTGLPAGWDPTPRAGAGGGSDNPAGLYHWAGPGIGGHVTALAPSNGLFDTETLLRAGGQIEILDGFGALGPTHEGFGVAYESAMDQCALAFVGYGVTEEELKRAVGGLYEVDATGTPTAGARGALWPEVGELEPGTADDLVRGRQPWRENPTETALRYAAEALDWRDGTVTDGEPSEDGRNGNVFTIRRDAVSNETTTVWVAKTVGRRWHSIYGIRQTIDTHCGVISTAAAGRLWIAAPPLADDSGNPPAGYDENRTTGNFIASAPGTADFIVVGAEPAKFRIARTAEPDPNSGCE